MAEQLRPGVLRLMAQDERRNGSAVRDVIDEPSDLSLPGMKTDVALVLPGDLTYEEWAGIAPTLRRMKGALQWWIGDYVLFGYDKFHEMASQIENDLGCTYQEIADYKYVAKAVPISRRREGVSFEHHRTIAPLDEEVGDAFLDECQEKGWTRKMLRAAVNEYKNPTPKAELACQCHCHQTGYCNDCNKPTGPLEESDA